MASDAPHHLPSCRHPVQGVLGGVNRGAHHSAHGCGLTRWAAEWTAVSLQDACALPVVHVVSYRGMQEVNQLSCLLDQQVIQGKGKHNVLVSLANNFTGFFRFPWKWLKRLIDYQNIWQWIFFQLTNQLTNHCSSTFNKWLKKKQKHISRLTLDIGNVQLHFWNTSSGHLKCDKDVWEFLYLLMRVDYMLWTK